MRIAVGLFNISSEVPQKALACCALLGKYLKVVVWCPGSEPGGLREWRAEGRGLTIHLSQRAAVWASMKLSRWPTR
jgi:hypothetical protein